VYGPGKWLVGRCRREEGAHGPCGKKDGYKKAPSGREVGRAVCVSLVRQGEASKSPSGECEQLTRRAQKEEDEEQEGCAAASIVGTLVVLVSLKLSRNRNGQVLIVSLVSVNRFKVVRRHRRGQEIKKTFFNRVRAQRLEFQVEETICFFSFSSFFKWKTNRRGRRSSL